MRTLALVIKLVVVALIIHATWQSASAFWVYHEFRDSLRDVAQFGSRRTEQEVRERAFYVATTLNLPIRADQIAVKREGGHTYISTSYKTDIEFLPRLSYPWTFQVDVAAFSVDFYKDQTPP